MTAGVLRGERARFQLFGDTVNVAARMESNGEKNRIHISKETADLLKSVGKAHWFTPREDKIVAKGKGEMTTFWLNVTKGDHQSTSSGSSSTPLPCLGIQSELTGSSFAQDLRFQSKSSSKTQRLVDWNVDVLLTLLKQVEKARRAAMIVPDSIEKLAEMEQRIREGRPDSTVIDEVVEIVALPQFQSGVLRQDPIEISPEALIQLRKYVSTIASMYNKNNFHNFEHARYVLWMYSHSFSWMWCVEWHYVVVQQLMILFCVSSFRHYSVMLQ